MIAVKKLGQHLGAEIGGVDLSKPLDEGTFAALSKAFFDNEVVVIRGQNLTPGQQIAFTKRFGQLEKHVRTETRLEGHDEIFIISNIIGDNGRPIGAQDAGRFWHSDLSYMAQPSMLSALYSIEVPIGEDDKVLGDTQYASTTAAYDALPETTKRRLEGLKAVHSYRHYWIKNHEAQRIEANNGGRVVHEPELTEEQRRLVPDVAPPLVRTHPVTGRKCLFVNEAHTSEIIGLSRKESDEILQSLYEHIIKPEFRYVHSWRAGDFLMWDNCAAQHKATFDYDLPLRRLMYRTTVRGSVLV